MMRHLSPLMVVLALAACASSPETHYYTLSVVAETMAPPPTAIRISHIAIPTLLDRPQFVEKSGKHEVQIMEYQRWAEPFDSMIQRVLTDDLNGTKSFPLPVQPLTVTINEFNADATGQVLLRASWITQNHHQPINHVFEKTAQANGEDADALVASMSELVGELAVAIRQAN